MATTKNGRNVVSHSTGPVIGNNIYLNIFNGYPVVPQTPGAVAKVLGRKVENQVSVHISDSSSLTDRSTLSYMIELNRRSGTWSGVLPAVQEAAGLLRAFDPAGSGRGAQGPGQAHLGPWRWRDEGEGYVGDSHA